MDRNLKSCLLESFDRKILPLASSKETKTPMHATVGVDGNRRENRKMSVMVQQCFSAART